AKRLRGFGSLRLRCGSASSAGPDGGAAPPAIVATGRRIMSADMPAKSPSIRPPAAPAPAATSSLHGKDAAWSGRFAEPVADFVLRYTASVSFDRRLALADIEGSLAHAEMLARAGVLSADDLAAIRRGLAQVRDEIERGAFEWQLALEDVHLNIEKRLTELVGDAGKRLHTGRSRNDQVATDMRLYLRGEIDRIVGAVGALQRALVELAARHTT